MIVDLEPLPYKTAINLVKMCVKYNIDTPRCNELIESMSVVPIPDIRWELDIPEKYLTFFMLTQHV